MVIGTGLIGNALKKYDKHHVCFFASGVSNSKEASEKQFERERLLLENTLDKHNDKQFIYFSTCSIYDSSLIDNKYVEHKQKMEDIVINISKRFIIFRLPQVVGKTNAPTLVNFLFKNIINGNRINILRDATRNLIYVDDVMKICNESIIRQEFENEIVNLATPFNEKVINIVHIIENIVNKKADYNLVTGGSNININIQKINSYKNIFNENYIEDILVKYYKKDFIIE